MINKLNNRCNINLFERSIKQLKLSVVSKMHIISWKERTSDPLMEKPQSGVMDVGRMPLKLSNDVLPRDQMPESMMLVTPEVET